ncbi:hypothetical protein ACRE_018260 [Hapsidospora chrysogenum ATCC 11550]|uniref:Uncharacterized protein n=1 Tax=Hapsidospora chrysogenum (strain ATCC 11550 / CBS 779.69 / DSM 880 / IAM 14645 / JCM 23072 / IMI 49137) TaxID=857340 RepID=A0A086TDI5_HAPC1|nr:hypothetical protein ACRE_018260 [Hapsidospora chrysogenum ATCC 11550]
MPLLSENTNLRQDAYGGGARARPKLAVDIVRAVRNTTPDTSCIGILVVAVDSDAIIKSGVDYVNVGGGTFEKPTASRS